MVIDGDVDEVMAPLGTSPVAAGAAFQEAGIETLPTTLGDTSQLLDVQLLPDGAGFVVRVDSRDPPGRQNFTVVHEICHTFFPMPAGPVGTRNDRDTGLYDIRDEEEYLCDLGAGRVLFHPEWLVPALAALPPGLDGLCAIASQAGASLEASAFQIGRSGCWPNTSFVSWEPGFRKRDRVPAGQLGFEGWESARDRVGKLRVSRVYPGTDAPFLPHNISAPDGSLIVRSLAEQGRFTGEVVFTVDRRSFVVECEAGYMPFRARSGELTARVLSCLRWRA